MLKHMDKLDRERKLKGQALYQDDDESLRTVDKFEHEHNTEDTLTIPKMGDESSPTQSDRKEEAQYSDASSPSTMTLQKIPHRQRDDAKMEKMFAALADNNTLQLKQQEERHAKEIADMRQANRDTHDMFTTKTIPQQTITMNDHRITAHFNTMMKASDTLFDGTPENWPICEHHLLTEAENPTIAWNQHITHFQPDKEEEPLNFLERYFDLPEDISQKLQLDLDTNRMADIMQVNSKLYKLHFLKTKLKNCLTPDLALGIYTSMPPGISNKDGRLFFIKLVLHTFLDKEAHKRIIYEYILKLEITESNNMESFQRELRRHVIQYEAIQGTKWKKITNHIIKQYQKIDSPPFYTGFNMIVVDGPSTNQTKYEWIINLLTCTTASRHDLLSRNLWPKPEIKTGQELNTMPMHDNQWGNGTNAWRSQGPSYKTKSWAASSPRLTTPRSISTFATSDQTTISYNPRQSKHIFTKINITNR
jgi:hypothetical protein